MKRWLLGATVMAALLGMARQGRCGYLVWTDNVNFGPGGDIRRANLDGSGQSTLISGLNSPDGVAVDPATGKMYWGDYLFGSDPSINTPNGDISRANLDGSNQEVVVSQQIFPISVALDVSAGKMYWIAHSQQTDPFGKDIRRANLDGTNEQTLVHTTGVIGNGQLAIDLAGGKIYTTDYNENRIRRFNLDGSGETTLISGLSGPVGIALDIPDGKLYWASNGNASIYEANLDGTGTKVVLTGLHAPSGLVVDPGAGKMYWTDYGANGVANGDISSANLDGSDRQVLVNNLNGPFSITLVPEPAGVALIGIAGCGLLRRTRHRDNPGR